MGFFDKFLDKEGIFQGGKQGRAFGRIKDFLAKSVPESQMRETQGRRLTEAFGMPGGDMGGGVQSQTHNVFGGDDERLTPEFASARIAALDFDPSDPESVKGLQRKLGVTVDGKFGPQTEAALRSVQGQMPMNDPTSLLDFGVGNMGAGPSQESMDTGQSYMSEGGYGEPPQWGGDSPIGDYVRGPLMDYYKDNPNVTPPPHLKDFIK